MTDRPMPHEFRASIADRLRTLPPSVDARGNTIKPAAAPTPATTNYDALNSIDPTTAVELLRSASRLGVDHATVTGLVDSAAFMASIEGADAAGIDAALSSRLAPPAPVLKPNPAQGSSAMPAYSPPPSMRDKLRDTL